MEKILVSRCLLGERVRYHGKVEPSQYPILEKWKREGRIVPICPEVEAGMPVPRPPSEIVGNKVLNKDGTDVTAQYTNGAKIALKLARENDIKLAILKSGSPSCGSLSIYDGTFSGTKKDGAGVTAGLLIKEGIRVFDEAHLESARVCFEKLITP